MADIEDVDPFSNPVIIASTVVGTLLLLCFCWIFRRWKSNRVTRLNKKIENDWNIPTKFVDHSADIDATQQNIYQEKETGNSTPVEKF